MKLTEPILEEIATWLLKNSKDIESEFVDIVNDKFWELI